MNREILHQRDDHSDVEVHDLVPVEGMGRPCVRVRRHLLLDDFDTWYERVSCALNVTTPIYCYESDRWIYFTNAMNP